MRKLILGVLLLSMCTISFAQKDTNPRATWFTDARFGMFIHWGVYSGAEGYWKGEKLRNDNDYAEWLMYRNRIEKGKHSSLIALYTGYNLNHARNKSTYEALEIALNAINQKVMQNFDKIETQLIKRKKAKE